MKRLIVFFIAVAGALLLAGCPDPVRPIVDKPTEQILSDISAVNVIAAPRTVTFPAVERYVRWDDTDRGTATYTAETGWVITDIQQAHYDTWESAGYSMRKVAAGQSTLTESLINETFGSISSVVAELQKNELEKKKINAELARARDLYMRNRQLVSSSHSLLHVDWRVEGSDNPFDRRRGKIDLDLAIKLERQATPTDLEAYRKAVLVALGVKPEETAAR